LVGGFIGGDFLSACSADCEECGLSGVWGGAGVGGVIYFYA